MKLYRRVDGMGWQEFTHTPGAICASYENTEALDVKWLTASCSSVVCALIPAPHAKRHAALGRAVIEHLDELDTPEGLREYADTMFMADDGAFALLIVHAIAAWMEAKGENDAH